ncbi:MAG: GNAT family N-acetyltransferase [Alphaproteobacteria bacterium]
MRRDDLVVVERIATIVHPAFPESGDVPRERLALFPQGCFIAAIGGREGSVGYAVAHPGMLGRPPALDTLLGVLAARADCLYLHDVALLPVARGRGLGAVLVDRLRGLARREGLDRLALVAVNRSTPFWHRMGFAPWPGTDASLSGNLASYGADAAYLVAPV